MNTEMTLDDLGRLARRYKGFITKNAKENAELDNLAKFKNARKVELWPKCISQINEAIEAVNAKLTNNPKETMMQREHSDDRFELLFCGGGFVLGNWLIEVDARGNILVQRLKRQSSVFVSATTVGNMEVVECSREKWENILIGFASKELEDLMNF
jgi:hypothetical protein